MSGSLHLLVRIAGKRVAFAAGAVEAVVEVESLTPIPRAPPNIAGLLTMRSRVLTVIDACAALGLERSGPAVPGEAVVMQWEGHPYALLVDSVEDAVELDACVPASSATSAFIPFAREVAIFQGGELPVVDPALLLGPVAGSDPERH